jgi:hypothetical protein
MGDSKAIGVAYRDQDLEGSTLTDCAVVDPTITGTVEIGSAVTDLVGFYGTTPADQPASESQAAAATTAPVSISATQWGFSTSTQAAAVLTLTNEMRRVLVELGLMKGSA